MHFVDLAGSEKQKSTLASGQRLKQASSINKSLTSLSIVIQKLSAKATHIPYRDSVLTKILRDSLGGNSRTILIATLSSKQQAVSQTISTINFATKAKKVKLCAHINQQYNGSVTDLRSQITSLQQQLKLLKQRQPEPKTCPTCQILRSEQQQLLSDLERVGGQLACKEAKIQEYEQCVVGMRAQYEERLLEQMDKFVKLERRVLGIDGDGDVGGGDLGTILQQLQKQNENLFPYQHSQQHSQYYNNNQNEKINSNSNTDAKNYITIIDDQNCNEGTDQNGDVFGNFAGNGGSLNYAGNGDMEQNYCFEGQGRSYCNLPVIMEQNIQNQISQISSYSKFNNILQTDPKLTDQNKSQIITPSKQKPPHPKKPTSNNLQNRQPQPQPPSSVYSHSNPHSTLPPLSTANHSTMLHLLKHIKSLQSQLQIAKIQKNRIQEEIAAKLQNQKEYYEPFIRKWVEENGGAIGNSMRNRNAVERDIMVGMRVKMREIREVMRIREEEWGRKERQYQRAIDEIGKLQARSILLNNKDSQKHTTFQNINHIKLSQNLIQPPSNLNLNTSQILSKSHPRTKIQQRTKSRFLQPELNDKNAPLGYHMSIQNQAKSLYNQIQRSQKAITELVQASRNNSKKSPIAPQSTTNKIPDQRQQDSISHNYKTKYHKLSEQYDRLQIQKDQLVHQLEAERVRAATLETEVQESRTLVVFWEEKCGKLRREVEECGERNQSLNKSVQRYQKLLLQKQRQYNSYKQNQSQQLTQTNHQLQQLQSKHNQSSSQTQTLKQTLTQTQQTLQQQTHKLSILQKIHQQTLQSLKQNNNGVQQLQLKYCGQEQKIKELMNSNYNLTAQVANIRGVNQSLYANNQKLSQKIKQTETANHEYQIQIKRLKQSHNFTKEQYTRNYKSKQKQMFTLQKQTSKIYKDWLDQLQTCKILKLKNIELEQHLQQLKKKSQKQALQLEDLSKVSRETQTQLYSHIHRLNQERRQLETNLERKQMMLASLSKQFENRFNQMKYWKGEYKKQKEQINELKKERREQKQRRNKSSSMAASRTTMNTPRSTKNEQYSTIMSNQQLQNYEYKQSRQQVKKIAEKLSQICQIQIDETNIILKLEHIVQKLDQFKKLKLAYPKLIENNRMLIQKINSMKYQGKNT